MNLPHTAVIVAHKVVIDKLIVDLASSSSNRTASVAVAFASFPLPSFLAFS
jgi:hypothetical protein